MMVPCSWYKFPVPSFCFPVLERKTFYKPLPIRRMRHVVGFESSNQQGSERRGGLADLTVHTWLPRNASANGRTGSVSTWVSPPERTGTAGTATSGWSEPHAENSNNKLQAAIARIGPRSGFAIIPLDG